MPTLRLARAPKRRPKAVAMTIARTTPSQGFQPRLSPFVFPFVTTLPSTKPAIPYSATCANDTIPPFAERKIRLAATMPSSSICVSSADTQ